jgi:hypothetical protein
MQLTWGHSLSFWLAGLSGMNALLQIAWSKDFLLGQT